MKSMRNFSKKSSMFPGGAKAHANPEDEFAELCRQATAKTLERPDADLNQQVVDAVTTDPGNAPSPQYVASTLRARLQLKNPHKVWLSLALIREVMDKCSSITHDDWQDVLVEVNRIASKPMNRYASDLPVQQRAKGAAFTLLRHIANEPVDGDIGSPRSPRPHRDSNTFAQQSPRSPNRQAASNGGPPANAWPRVRQAISNQLALVNSKLETVQEAVLSLSSGEGSAKADSQQAFLKEVVVEMEAYRSKFEPLLSQLSSFDSPEATQLMSRALETMDVINNIINLQDEVVNAKRPDASLQPAAVAPTAPAQIRQLASSARPSSDPLDAIAELQQALNGVQLDGSAAHARPAADPFAASSLESHASNSFSPQASNNPFKPAPYNPMAGPANSPTHAGALSHQNDHLTQGNLSYSSHPVPAVDYLGPAGQQQHSAPQANSSTDSWGGSTDFSPQPQSQQQQARTGFSGYPGMHHQGQHQQQPYQLPHQQHYAAPQHAHHPAANTASSDAWGMAGAHSAILDGAYPQSQSQPSHAENYLGPLQMQAAPQAASQHSTNPFQPVPAPAAHATQPNPAESIPGSEWDSLFSRSTSQSAMPASPSADKDGHAQLQKPDLARSVPLGLPGRQSAPPSPASLTNRSAHLQKEAQSPDPFDELFSAQSR